MTFSYDPGRQGVTVLPDDIDDATGERIPGSAQVKDSSMAGLVEDQILTDEQLQQSLDEQHEVSINDPDSPDYIPEEVQISDTFQDVISNDDICQDPEVGERLLAADIGDSPSATVVKHLSYKWSQGEMTPEEAFNAAVDSGIEPKQLIASYWALYYELNPDE